MFALRVPHTIGWWKGRHHTERRRQSEIALVQTGRRTATVVATSAMRLMVLSEGSFATVRGEIPEIVGHIRTAVDERMTAARHR